MLRYENQRQVLVCLKRRFPIPQEHYKPDKIIQRHTEFYVLRKFLKTGAPLIQYPLEIEYFENSVGYPDFLVSFNGAKFLLEITEWTNQNSQLIFQNKIAPSELGILGSLDLTAAFKKCIESKNSKKNRYEQCTGVQNSILLVDHNAWPPFSYGAPGDHLKLTELESVFDHTFLLVNIYGSDKNYLELPPK